MSCSSRQTFDFVLVCQTKSVFCQSQPDKMLILSGWYYKKSWFCPTQPDKLLILSCSAKQNLYFVRLSSTKSWFCLADNFTKNLDFVLLSQTNSWFFFCSARQNLYFVRLSPTKSSFCLASNYLYNWSNDIFHNKKKCVANTVPFCESCSKNPRGDKSNIYQIGRHYQFLRKKMFFGEYHIIKKITQIEPAFLCKTCFEKYMENIISSNKLFQDKFSDLEISISSNVNPFSLFHRYLLQQCYIFFQIFLSLYNNCIWIKY